MNLFFLKNCLNDSYKWTSSETQSLKSSVLTVVTMKRYSCNYLNNLRPTLMLRCIFSELIHCMVHILNHDSKSVHLELEGCQSFSSPKQYASVKGKEWNWAMQLVLFGSSFLNCEDKLPQGFELWLSTSCSFSLAALWNLLELNGLVNGWNCSSVKSHGVNIALPRIYRHTEYCCRSGE